MAGEFLVTIGDRSNIKDVFQGPFLKGRNQPRIAFVGRSNVGKSSLINALLEDRVAQISKQPGKTSAIHFYLWKDTGKIVADLPGYGYARVSQGHRRRWADFIQGYFDSDPRLERALVILDARHGPTDLDQEAIRFLSLESIPVTFVFAKLDTLKSQSERAMRQKEGVGALQELMPKLERSSIFWVSSKSEEGLKLLGKSLLE